jgi:hypothetical protein
MGELDDLELNLLPDRGKSARHTRATIKNWKTVLKKKKLPPLWKRQLSAELASHARRDRKK